MYMWIVSVSVLSETYFMMAFVSGVEFYVFLTEQVRAATAPSVIGSLTRAP